MMLQQGQGWKWLPVVLAAVAAVGCRGGGPGEAGGPGSRPVEVRRPDSGSEAGAPASGTLRVSFVEVGQGDAELIQAPGATVLIDGGPPEAGPAVIEAMRDAGVQRLDWIIGSHPHADHIGGLVDVLRQIPVAQALDPGYDHGTSLQKSYLKLLKDKRVRTTRARAGQTYDLGGGAKLHILAPAELLRNTDSDANNNSIVARLDFGKTRFLFTGDMEEDERAQLLARQSADALRADVLKVAHHGSHNGTDPEFLRAVRPRYGVISLARRNDYGHPHKEPLAQMRGAGVTVLRTDQQGTIVFTSDGQKLSLQGAPPSTASTPEPPPARASGTDPRPSSTGAEVIGNESSKVFHAPDCSALPAPERRVRLKSAGEARRQGYRAHAACMN